MTLPEAYRSLYAAARLQGWTVTRGKRSGHLRWKSPGGQVFTTASTPSDRRGVLNDAAMLRRAGLRLEESARGSRT